jgi:hypothetical protein
VGPVMATVRLEANASSGNGTVPFSIKLAPDRGVEVRLAC